MNSRKQNLQQFSNGLEEGEISGTYFRTLLIQSHLTGESSRSHDTYHRFKVGVLPPWQVTNLMDPGENNKCDICTLSPSNQVLAQGLVPGRMLFLLIIYQIQIYMLNYTGEAKIELAR
jgi:hypothetical protein